MKIGSLIPKNNIFLAPMAGITDLPFRLLCAEMGTGLTYTEMVSAKGLYYNDNNTCELTKIHPAESPAAIQIFGTDPGIMAEVASRLSEREDVALIDINMGCPAPKIVKNGEGCALMQKPHLAAQIIRSVSLASNKPVTVKFRKGWDDNSINALSFALLMEENGAAAVTLHSRTREQFYSGQADWNTIREIKNKLAIPVIGNGDVFTPDQAKAMLNDTGCDAVMVARGAQGNPWLFKRILESRLNDENPPYPSDYEKLAMIKRHYELLIYYKGEYTAVREMRKHIAWYVKGMPGAGNFRTQVFLPESKDEVFALLDIYFKTLNITNS